MILDGSTVIKTGNHVLIVRPIVAYKRLNDNQHWVGLSVALQFGGKKLFIEQSDIEHLIAALNTANESCRKWTNGEMPETLQNEIDQIRYDIGEVDGAVEPDDGGDED